MRLKRVTDSVPGDARSSFVVGDNSAADTPDAALEGLTGNSVGSRRQAAYIDLGVALPDLREVIGSSDRPRC